MKPRFAVALLILILSAISFGQSDAEAPKRAFQEFWKFVLENNSADAKKLVSKHFFANLNSDLTADAVARISINRIEIEGISRQTISADSAYFEVSGIDSANRRWEAQIALHKYEGDWRIVVLSLRRESDLNSDGQPVMPKIKPFRLVPDFPKGLPQKIDCPKCI